MPPNPAANTYPFVERVRYVIPLVYAAGLVLEGRWDRGRFAYRDLTHAIELRSRGPPFPPSVYRFRSVDAIRTLSN